MASVSRRQWTYNGKSNSAWIVRYLDIKGVHKQKTFKSKKEADRFCHQVEADAYNGVAPLASETMTIARVCELFLKAQEDRRRDGRIGKTREYQLQLICRKSIIPYIGKMKATDLNSLHVEQFYTDMIRDQGLSPSSAKDRIQDLSLIARFAISRDLMRNDPVPAVVKTLRGISQPKIRILKINEVRAIMKAVEKRPHGQAERPYLFIKIYIFLALSCGLRWGEIRAPNRTGIGALVWHGQSASS